jgi:hypothetical protein
VLARPVRQHLRIALPAITTQPGNTPDLKEQEFGPMTGTSEALKAALDRRLVLQREIDERTKAGLLSDAEVAHFMARLETGARAVLDCARHTNDQRELKVALADVCSAIPETKPDEAIALAQEFAGLPPADDELDIRVASALQVAYLSKGDTVRAAQQGARATRLRKQRGKVTFQDAAAVIRAASIPPPKKVTIEFDKQDILEWLYSKDKIGLSDLAPSFGNFVTNDRDFYRTAKALLQMCFARLKAGLSKPDNYLLIAEPGLGKSFFVREFKEQLQREFGEDIIFLERNLSAYDRIDAAFQDIITDVIFALNSHNPVFLFIDEVDTLLDGKSILERLIAPMNGDPFFFLRRQLSFAKQNLVVFFALSSKQWRGGRSGQISFLEFRAPTGLVCQNLGIPLTAFIGPSQISLGVSLR